MISVAMCTYNGEKFIYAQLESILKQDKAVDEIVICDDCSSDTTIKIIDKIMSEYTSNITLLRNSVNMGAIRSFEKCIQACSGDIIFLADQDDIWRHDKVVKYIAAFDSDSKIKAVFSNGELIGEDDEPLHTNLWAAWNFTPELQKKWRKNDFAFCRLAANQNVITGATLAFRKDILPLMFPFELPSAFWHDAWIGLLAAGLGEIRFLTESTIYYRIHQQQQVGLKGAIDKKFDPIPYDQFQQKLLGLFPYKKKLIFVKKPFSRRIREVISSVKSEIRKVLGS